MRLVDLNPRWIDRDGSFVAYGGAGWIRNGEVVDA
jgi:hypothetical protein